MRIVGVFDVDRPAPGEGIGDLQLDLLVAEIGQEGELSLGDAHVGFLLWVQALAVAVRVNGVFKIGEPIEKLLGDADK